MQFFVGLHHPSDAPHFDRAFISVNAIKKRRGHFPVNQWIMDSGAFTILNTHGEYQEEPEVYAAEIRRWARNGELLAACSQDYMCEPFMLAKTGKTVAEHQALTIERYDRIVASDTAGIYIIPVLQGFEPEDYVSHIRQYAGRLRFGAWVGVGSVCKRNGDPDAIFEVLDAIKEARPDLRLHGFGVKLTALLHPQIRALLHTADSMAWSFAARQEGGDPNDWREAKVYEQKVNEAMSNITIVRPLRRREPENQLSFLDGLEGA